MVSGRRVAGAGEGPYHATVTQVLLVEDDERISQPLLHMLGREGWAPLHAADGAAALAALAGTTPSLVLLDLSLPDVDGLDLCATIRRDHPTLPIVMLTARAQEVDVVVGLGAGADDYVTKPFRVAELVARIRARLRAADAAEAAAGGTTAAATATPGDGLRVDADARRAWLDGEELALTPKEFDLLAYLAARPGVALRREQIMSVVWDEQWWGSTRTLDTHVAALRRKLGDSGDPARFITTVRGVGLRFEGA